MSALRQVLSDQFRLLTFRPIRPDLRAHVRAYLAYGMFVTWLAGVGRYWDNPRASLWQHLGLGSVAYVLVLSALLWLVVKPLRPRHFSYAGVVVFVTLTSLPALLYAIPVEQFMPMKSAQAANVGFLAIVATWRVVLLVLFLRRAAGLGWFSLTVATLLPLTLIVFGLAIFNLEHVVFNLMAGNTPEQVTANDKAYFVVLSLAFFSFLALPVVAAAYAVLVVRAIPVRSESRVPPAA